MDLQLQTLQHDHRLVSLMPECASPVEGPWKGKIDGDQYAEMNLEVISAPANFSTPLTLHSKFSALFVVRVTFRHPERLRLNFALQVFSLSEEDCED